MFTQPGNWSEGAGHSHHVNNPVRAFCFVSHCIIYPWFLIKPNVATQSWVARPYLWVAKGFIGLHHCASFYNEYLTCSPVATVGCLEGPGWWWSTPARDGGGECLYLRKFYFLFHLFIFL